MTLVAEVPRGLDSESSQYPVRKMRKIPFVIHIFKEESPKLILCRDEQKKGNPYCYFQEKPPLNFATISLHMLSYAENLGNVPSAGTMKSAENAESQIKNHFHLTVHQSKPQCSYGDQEYECC